MRLSITLSLPDAVQISTLERRVLQALAGWGNDVDEPTLRELVGLEGALESVVASVDRKSTRLNSSHVSISYAVFRMKKEKRSIMAVIIHITIIELNALHTIRQNLCQELDAVIHHFIPARRCADLDARAARPPGARGVGERSRRADAPRARRSRRRSRERGRVL